MACEPTLFVWLCEDAAGREANTRAGAGLGSHRGASRKQVMLKETVDGEFTTSVDVAEVAFVGALNR